MNTTLSYYASHASEFAAGTVGADFSEVSDRFLALLPEHPLILDYGCGSGRDSKYFLEKGCEITAADGSEELCRIASAYIGQTVRHMLFQELDEVEVYDGIWACASILHLPKRELPDVFRRMIRALKNKGIIYTSFKYGDFEGERNGRMFTDFTETSAAEFLKQFSELQVVSQWVSGDVRPGRENEKWLNLMLRKSI